MFCTLLMFVVLFVLTTLVILYVICVGSREGGPSDAGTTCFCRFLQQQQQQIAIIITMTIKSAARIKTIHAKSDRAVISSLCVFANSGTLLAAVVVMNTTAAGSHVQNPGPRLPVSALSSLPPILYLSRFALLDVSGSKKHPFGSDTASSTNAL